MTPIRRHALLAVLAAGVVAATAAATWAAPSDGAAPTTTTPASADTAPDADATRLAMRTLLAAADAPVPRGSTCQGSHGQKGVLTIKDLVVSRLSVMARGTNVVEGACRDDRCSITLRHADGEDVSSAVITFDAFRGRAQPRTLRCVMTP